MGGQQAIITEKQRLRGQFERLRGGIPAQARREKSRKIWECLFETNRYHAADSIFTYLNFRGEVETLPFLQRVIQDGKTVVVPVCVQGKKEMKLYCLKEESQLVRGAYGILEPNPLLIACGEVVPAEELRPNDLALVPALAFDREGFRLGYGGGYYDRFLKETACHAVGMAFSCCVCEALPREKHDQKVEGLITETGCEFFDADI